MKQLRQRGARVRLLLSVVFLVLGLASSAARDSVAQERSPVPSLPAIPDLERKLGDKLGGEAPDEEDGEKSGDKTGDAPESNDSKDNGATVEKEVAATAEKAPETADDSVGEPRNTPSTREIAFEGGAGKVVLHIKIHDVIDLGLAPFITRVVETAEARGDVVAIISEIDTPGGRVDAAVQIRDALLRSKIPTVAWVNTQAISAGALIAYAHDYIVVAEGGSMGAATPIQMGGGGQAEPVEEKMTSYMRSVMRATAEANDRDGDIAEAMVDRTIAVPGVTPKGKLLTASQRQMMAWGIADLRADTWDDLLDKLNLKGATVEHPKLSWAEHIARFLTHPVTSSLLMTFGFLGLLIEFYTPGFGFAGGIGIACLLLFFAGHMIVELAGLEELLLFFLGLALLGVEIFVTPGFGILGALGIVAILASLVLALIGLPIDVSFDSGAFLGALGRVSLAGIVTVIAGFVVLKFLPRTGPGRRLVLADVAGVGGPQTLATPPDDVARQRPRDAVDGGGLAGAVGEALTDLRPAGRALVLGRRYDVVTEGDYVKRGAAVEVVSASPMRVVVRPAADKRPADERPAGDDTRDNGTT